MARELAGLALVALALVALVALVALAALALADQVVDKVVRRVDDKVVQVDRAQVGADPELVARELVAREVLEEGSKVHRRWPMIRSNLFGMQCSLTRTAMVNLAVTSL